jgi:hypothetical protein
MENKLPEHFGKITKIVRDEGYVKSFIDNNYYYFKTQSLYGNLQLWENVAFLIEDKPDKQIATKIRRIYQNKKGIRFIQRVISSHIHRGVEPFLSQIFEQISDFDAETIEKDFPFPCIIGKSTCVSTNENDKIFYAKREDRSGHSRFVLNREPIDTNKVSVNLLKVPTHYLIISAYLGGKAEREPWDKRASSSALEFWKNHAFVDGYEKMIIESKTDICPW